MLPVLQLKADTRGCSAREALLRAVFGGSGSKAREQRLSSTQPSTWNQESNSELQLLQCHA
eukprot:421954-Rhodomonas_salina.1